MSGNEAIARGAYEWGIRFGVGYPGTPSTEILEEFSKYDGVYAEWAPNEKVGLEVGIGAAVAGARALVTMKHVGVNVAADPLFTVSYTGTNGALVIITQLPERTGQPQLCKIRQDTHARTGRQPRGEGIHKDRL